MGQSDKGDAMAQDVSVDLGPDNVAVVEIHRPPNNYFSRALIAEIASACEELASGPCRAIVLCSEGRHFCAGADFTTKEDDSSGRHLYDEAARLFVQPLPIVAAVQGAAIGGGLGLALAADFRVATADARFAANFSRLGFHHGFALSATLPAAVGQHHALDLLYTGRRIDGQEALRIGLVDRLVLPDALRSTALAWAAEIAESAPLAVRSIRSTMRAALVSDAIAAMDRERIEQDRLRRTNDFKEGIRSTKDRRPAAFTGT
jgi:2-(1,2-epoxy-1,2-dihydrophenyl)acetyl-CoA isomerase